MISRTLLRSLLACTVGLAAVVWSPARARAQSQPAAAVRVEAGADVHVAAGIKTDATPMTVVTTGAAPPSATSAPVEIFPLAAHAWLHTLDLGDADYKRIDAARRSLPGSWFCRTPAGAAACSAQGHVGPAEGYDDAILLSIRHMLPWAASAITVYNRRQGLLYDPRLVGHAVNNLSRWKGEGIPRPAPPPMPAPPRAHAGKQDVCPPVPMPSLPPSDGELQLVFRWPTPAETGDFRYIAVVDECNNAVVTRFARQFYVPAEVEATDSCTAAGVGRGPLKLLRGGTTLHVTAFNLDAPTRGNVLSSTYRVTVPNMETDADGHPAPVLVPDFSRDDLRLDCSATEAPKAKPKPASDKCPAGPPPRAGHAMADESFVIGPEPLRTGRCRIVFDSPRISRLSGAPLLLHVTLERVDVAADAGNRGLVHASWLVSPGPGRSFVLPPLGAIEGDSRLRLTVSSDPAGASGKAIVFTDALRGVKHATGTTASGFRRDIASSTITTAALCGGWDFRTIEETGSCFRAYITVPVMLATFQMTRAPWEEKPIIDPSVPGGIGVALAFDRYDPAKQQAFPLSLQIGGAFEKLTDSKNGILAYVGLMPSLPVLGKGGTTTSIGLLAGLGLTYIMDSAGPNEGFKPALFVAVVIGTGQFVLKATGANTVTSE